MDEALVIYDSPHVPRGRRVVVALLFGALPPIVGAWWRWVRQRGGGPAAVHIMVGAGVALVMIVAALRSRTVYRVELTARELRVHRDPGVIERWPLREVSVRSEPAVGGWSRSPSERLVITAADGASAHYALPDDADTPGVARDIDRVKGGAPLAALLEESATPDPDL